jgi:hypothetical protein
MNCTDGDAEWQVQPQRSLKEEVNTRMTRSAEQRKGVYFLRGVVSPTYSFPPLICLRLLYIFVASYFLNGFTDNDCFKSDRYTNKIVRINAYFFPFTRFNEVSIQLTF